MESMSYQSKIEAWEYNPSDDDQRLPHKYPSNRPVPLEHIHDLGILTWKLDVNDWENNPFLNKIKEERGYKYWEVATLARGVMEDYETKVKGFFQEHMHSQEEIRLILDGGYWDIRDYDDNWIRFRVEKGDLIVLPPGMCHRFTLDVNDYIKALLIYTEVPARTQHERDDHSAARKSYVEKVLKNPLALHKKIAAAS
ncbi:hypothetical protein O6H91_13G025800 [Diphasiastrum complanatum]|uniref:Uncharacterized protein n=1 Tax=Diphasiastrum complanatum TaxID=34168 RepID=A0ACC2BT47_DIPCM|nr:hypothetical protein O6H91_13G025800 [Diphasiastrum complanatum]